MTDVWLKGDGFWISLAAVQTLAPVDLGGAWGIGAHRGIAAGIEMLEGTYPSSAAASDAIRKLCNGVTVAELTD